MDLLTLFGKITKGKYNKKKHKNHILFGVFSTHTYFTFTFVVDLENLLIMRNLAFD